MPADKDFLLLLLRWSELRGGFVDDLPIKGLGARQPAVVVYGVVLRCLSSIACQELANWTSIACELINYMILC
jgi:hypothetical protein